MRPPLEFWFEFASTYSYPAALRIEAQCVAAGVPLRWRPFLLGPIFVAQGWRDSPFNIYPAKGRNMWRDLARLCAAYGLPLRQPSVFPRNGLLAARVACAGADAPWLPAFVRAVYTANFADDRDIADPAVLSALLTELGQEPEPMLAAAQSPAIKEALRAQTEEAIGRGIYGAPSFTIGDELFWGNDRLEAALAYQLGRAESDDAGIDAVLHFWFGAPNADPNALTKRRESWFAAAPEFDAECRDRFAPLVGRAMRGELDTWQRTPRGRLALIMLLDQLTRNIFRGTAAAYLGDAKALPLALAGIDSGADRALGVFERAFFYLPLEHAENAAVQERSVVLFSQLLAESPPERRADAEVWLNYAREHRDTIARFGRFPQRNAHLGRSSTSDERAFLEGAAR
jgi:uncharacterized protein (DUF924 family)/2-hydroxychromene-2-carboxylate isomerase